MAVSQSGGARLNEPPTQQRASPITLEFGDRPRSLSGLKCLESMFESQREQDRLPETDDHAASAELSDTTRSHTDFSSALALPPRKVFPIQIGDKLFRLCGASLSSDAPSYFTQSFQEQLQRSVEAENVRTLYVDRDSTTFEDIALHLRGYYVQPRDGSHFAKLFADAQFFRLPKLTTQLLASAIHVQIGGRKFQVPRDLFSGPGDSPNYFSLALPAFSFLPAEIPPESRQGSSLRAPSSLPPSVPNRSANTFADLLHVLKGYPLEIRNSEHRAELLRDARYFHLKGLEQRLIPHKISYNLARDGQEITLRLEDIKPSGVSFVADSTTRSSAATPSPNTGAIGPGWIFYQRPYADAEAYNLIVETDGQDSTFLEIPRALPSSVARVGHGTFYRQSLARISSLFSVIASRLDSATTSFHAAGTTESGSRSPDHPVLTGISEEGIKVRIGPDADIRLNGKEWLIGAEEQEEGERSGVESVSSESPLSGRKRKRSRAEADEGEEWIVRRAQWRLRIQPVSGHMMGAMEIVLGAVKIDAWSSERARNSSRAFLM